MAKWRTIIHRKTGLTDAATNQLLRFDIATTEDVAGRIHYSVVARDNGAPNGQVLDGVIGFCAYNLAGVYTKDPTALTVGSDERIAQTTGTLTALWRLVDGTNAVILEVQPDSNGLGSIDELYVDLRVKMRIPRNVVRL